MMPSPTTASRLAEKRRQATIGAAEPRLQARLRPLGQQPVAAWSCAGLAHRARVLGSSVR